MASILSGLSVSTENRSASDNRSTRSARSGGSRNRNPLRSNARGFEEPILREIIEDIESNGGLKFVLSHPHSLTSFCDARVQEGKDSIYGLYKTAQRDKVSNKIRVWGRLEQEEWRNILLFCATTPAELRPNFAEQFGQPQQFPRVVSVPAGDTPRARSNRRASTPTTPRNQPATRTPRTAAAASGLTQDTDSTPKNSNLRPARGGFTHYREPASVLSSSDEEVEPTSLHFSSRGKMSSIQRPDDVPVGTWILLSYVAASFMVNFVVCCLCLQNLLMWMWTILS